MMMHWALMPLAEVEVGGYVSMAKTVTVIVIVLGWAWLATWVDKDAPAAHLPREWMNLAVFGSGLLGFLLLLMMPGFLVGLAVMIFCMLGGVGTYLGMRHKEVGLADLKKQILDFFKGRSKPRKVETKPGQVVIVGRNGNPVPEPAGDAPERAAYDGAQELLADPLRKNAERIEVRPSEGHAAVAVTIDGVAYNAPSMSRPAAAATITFVKQTAGLDVADKRKPQTGSVRVLIDKVRHELEVQTAGSTEGEYLRVTVDPKKRHERKPDDLGLLPDQLALLKQVAADGKGVVLVAAPRGQGLTTMLYAMLRAHDAFLTHIQSIERNMEADLEGITQNRLAPAATAAEEIKQVEWVASQQPDTIMVDSVTAPASARELLKFAAERRVYVGIRAGSAIEALTQWRKLVGDEQMAVSNLRMAMAGRVVRRLCSACKTGYAPDPEQLRKMNLDPTRVTKLYSARTQPLRDKKGNPVPCTFCQELRFKGRFGIFELLVIDDDVRQAVLSGAGPAQIARVFRKQRGLLLQEAALTHVQAGETSVQEVLRVMRIGEEPQPGRPARAAPSAG